MKTPRAALVSLLACLVVGPAGAQAFTGGKKSPAASIAPSPVGRNVLILVADDLGIEQLALYGTGQDFPYTPRIDELAANGVTFLNAWSNPNCSPTRAGFLTGRHAFRTGVGHVVFSYTQALPRSEYTLAEALDLGTASYASGMFGKWHLGSNFNGGLLSANMAGWERFDGSMLGFAGSQDYYDWQRVIDGSVATCIEYATTVQVDAALQWLQSAPEPWVCFVPFMAPHTPHMQPPEGLYYEDLSGTPGERKLFKATVEALDTEMGRLLDGIEQAGYARPLIIFAADNGTDDSVVVPPVVAGKAKGTLYEGGIHVPLIVSGWGQIPPGSRCESLVQMLDIFETATDFAGLDVRAELPQVAFDSKSLRPLLADPSGPPTRTHLYSEAFWPIGPGTPFWHHQAVRDQRYKLIINSNGEFFYDLELDPTETSNLLIGPLTIEQQAAYAGLENKLAVLMASR